MSLKTLRKIATAFDVALIVKFVPYSQFVKESQRVTLGQAISDFSNDSIEHEFRFTIIGASPSIKLKSQMPNETPRTYVVSNLSKKEPIQQQVSD